MKRNVYFADEITRRLVRSLPTEYPKTKFLGQERDYLDEEFVKLPAIKGKPVNRKSVV